MDAKHQSDAHWVALVHSRALAREPQFTATVYAITSQANLNSGQNDVFHEARAHRGRGGSNGSQLTAYATNTAQLVGEGPENRFADSPLGPGHCKFTHDKFLGRGRFAAADYCPPENVRNSDGGLGGTNDTRIGTHSWNWSDRDEERTPIHFASCVSIGNVVPLDGFG